MILISWFFSLYHCFANFFEMIEIFSHQHLYEIHQKFFFSHQCQWFIQNEQARQHQKQARWKVNIEQVVTQTFRACFKISKQQQVENEIHVAKKQQIEQQRFAKHQTKKTRQEKKRLKVFVCKRCFVKFSNNIKFHEYIRNHYTKKFKAIALSIFFISFISSTLLAKFIFFVAFNMSSQMSFISSLTLFTILFAKSLATSKKTYLTINDFFVMFIEKIMSLNLIHHQKNKLSSYH